MSELEQELMQTSEVDTGSELSLAQDVETGQDTQTQEEIWKQDKRFGNVWNSADDVYNSVKYYEQKFDPIRQTLEKAGYSKPEELEQVLSKYPEYEQSAQVLEKLNALLGHEVYGSKLQSVFKEIQQGFEREKYGAAIEDLPPHIQEQLRKVNQVESELNQIKEERELNSNVETIHSQMTDISKLCENYGFEIDAQAFLMECQEKGINPSQIKGYFFENNFDSLVETAKKQASLGTLNKNKEIKSAAGSSSQKTGSSVETEPNSFKELKEQLLK